MKEYFYCHSGGGGNPCVIARSPDRATKQSSPRKSFWIASLAFGVTAALWPGVAQAGLRETLTEKLKEYCIPKEGGCSYPYKANHTASGCVCPSGGRYYNGLNRRCEACSAGTYALPDDSTCTSCAAGQYAVGTGNTSCTSCPEPASCPAGTYKVDTTSGCPAGHYEVTVVDCDLTTGADGGPDSCLAGQYIITW